MQMIIKPDDERLKQLNIPQAIAFIIAATILDFGLFMIKVKVAMFVLTYWEWI